jgi:hypothetical protein
VHGQHAVFWARKLKINGDTAVYYHVTHFWPTLHVSLFIQVVTICTGSQLQRYSFVCSAFVPFALAYNVSPSAACFYDNITSVSCTLKVLEAVHPLAQPVHLSCHVLHRLSAAALLFLRLNFCPSCAGIQRITGCCMLLVIKISCALQVIF